MKTRLSYKIFAAFLILSFMLVVLMVGSYRYFMELKFWEFVNQTILTRMDGFVTALIDEHHAGQGWQRLAGDEERWHRLMAASLHGDDFTRPPQQFAGQASPKKADGKVVSGRTQKDGFLLPHWMVRGLVLIDERQQRVVGAEPAVDLSRFTLRPLNLEDRTIGWLGLHKREHFTDPIVMAYLKEQSRYFYYIGGLILALAAVVSLILSRHLLAPIRQLTRATHDLASFRFDTRIGVRSNDELGQLAGDFNRMADRLKKYEELRRQWISDISHELRTPLSILTGEIEALQDGVRPLTTQSLDSLHAEVRHLSKLVKDLHDLSLADSQSLLAQRQPVQPLTILSQTITTYRNRLIKAQISLHTQLGAESQVILLGDASRLVQLFTNLMENSMRYTDTPGILRIGEKHDARGLTIWFEDSPPGVPEHALASIFERLYRVESSRSRNLGGSGLGLAICKQIVEAHGGDIGAASSELGGLRLTIRLPLLTEDRKPR